MEKNNDEEMKSLEDLKILFTSFFKKTEPEERKMIRIFQWKRYIEWNDLTPQEKISAKRFLLIPVLAYLIVELINQNFTLIVLLLIVYVLYKKFNKGGIVKK